MEALVGGEPGQVAAPGRVRDLNGGLADYLRPCRRRSRSTSPAAGSRSTVPTAPPTAPRR